MKTKFWLIIPFISVCLLSFAQDSVKVIKGQVSDYYIPVYKTMLLHGVVTNNQGVALKDVRVMIKNGAASACTDAHGAYHLEVVDNDTAFVFYYPHMKWLVKARLPKQLTLNAVLQPEGPQQPILRKAAQPTVWYDPAHYTPHTYCNPLDISYNFEYYNHSDNHNVACRSTADPMILVYKGEYYLFSTNQSGFFVSKNLANWKFYYSGFQRKYNDDDQCAPAALAIGDTLLMIGSTYDNLPVWYSTHPKDERWKHLCETALLPHWDPDLFLDTDGKLYLYYGSSNEYPLMGVEYNRSTFRPESIIYNTISLHPDIHGWERFGMNNDDSVTLKPFAEGSFMTKHNGKYYLQYAAPGTEFKVYADGTYVSDHPLGPFVYQKHNPFSYKPGGFVRGAGHGGTFEDLFGNYWHIATCMLSLREKFERRIGLYPAGFDKDGILYANTAFGDYPTRIPQGREDHIKGNFTGWMLLSLHKKVWASSTDSIYVPGNAADENMRTFWAAKSNKPGEWFCMDLGSVDRINALQINYYDYKADQYGRAMDLYHQYKIYASDDAIHWWLVVDKSDNDLDVPHDYVELKAPLYARYLKIINLHMPTGNFALMDFRVFGKGNGEIPHSVYNFMAKRDPHDRRNVMFSWTLTKGAYGYNIYYGIAPDKCYNCITVYGANDYDMRGLDKNTTYYAYIKALGESGVSPQTAPVKME
ncbi:family 43 glycosylhydrolase [Microbacter margulisiae]|uniref:F5/8 type C domain-containing protein n=1 Tax=Microbacter margulisiae TaxID=1350067 RepID=A0A7W5DPC7_9PORP|nr:family 43 glycosylhydrolase [Microbacter margulisiae]MBB3186610.1 hypothetical protein [Microbacter margulisiae]